MSAWKRLHAADHFGMMFAAELGATHDQPPRRGGSRGPIPQWTETVRASLSPDQVAKLDRIAKRRRKSRSALIREAVDLLLSGAAS